MMQGYTAAADAYTGPAAVACIAFVAGCTQRVAHRGGEIPAVGPDLKPVAGFGRSLEVGRSLGAVKFGI